MPEASTTNGNGAASDSLIVSIANAILPYIKDQVTTKVDASDVERIVNEKIRDLTVPVKIEMVKEHQVVKTVDQAHKMVPHLIALMQDREHVYIWGPPGSGKSHATKQAAEALGLPFYYLSLNPQSPAWRIEGFIDANGVYVPTLFRKAYEHGGVFCIDELDNCNGSLLTSLNSCTANGRASFPDGMIEKHPDFILVATGNTALRGADRFFPERRPIDPATIDRFVYIEWDYDPALERAIVSGIDDKALDWMTWVHSVRSYAKQHTLKGCWATPRASITGARQWKGIKTDKAIANLAEALCFKGIDRDTVKRVLEACPLPKVS